MSALELRVYEIFKTRLGGKEAVSIIEYFNAKADAKYEDKKDTLATRQDLSETKADLIKWLFGFFTVLTLMIIGLYLKK